jgi:hypothetical protein
MVDVCPINTACKNIVDHFHGLFANITGIRFDSHISHWKEAFKNSLVLFAFHMSLEPLLTVFSNFHAFHCFTAAEYVSLLTSVSQLVIQALEYMIVCGCFEQNL